MEIAMHTVNSSNDVMNSAQLANQMLMMNQNYASATEKHKYAIGC
jgi:hypothetical protein